MKTRFGIFKDVVNKSTDSFNSVILTSFSFDPVFFTNYFMPKLRSVNATNILVLIDADRYDEAMEQLYGMENQSSSYPSLSFTPVRVKSRGNGVFHSKVALFVGESKCLAMVGSGNLTCGGTSYNEEVWNAFCADSPESIEAPIINAVWKYIQSLLDGFGSENVREQMKWLTDYSKLLHEIEVLDTTVMDNGAERITLLHNEPLSGIFEQLKDSLSGEKVVHLSMLAPYYDNSGRALATLIDAFEPLQVDCFVDTTMGLIPKELPDSYKQRIKFHNMKGKRTHAKIIQLETDSHTWVLSGSANITSAALGIDAPIGNEEASVLLRTTKSIDYIKELGFEQNPVDIFSSAVKGGSKSLPTHTRDITIRSCELWDGMYRLRLDKSVQNVDLCVLHFSGTSDILSFDTLNAEQDLPISQIEDAISLVIQRDGVCISNRVFILDQDSIQKGCPDRIMKQLAELFGKTDNSAWWKNISSILNNVYVEENHVNEKRSGTVQILAKSNKDMVETNVDEDSRVYAKDYDNVVFKGDGFSSRINESVFEFIFSGMRQEFDVEESDEKNSVRDVEDGKAAKSQKKKKTSIIESPSAIDASMKYLDRLDRMYMAPLKEFDSKKKKPITLRLDPFRKGIAPIKPSLTSYSAILVAVALMMRVSNDNNQERRNAKIEAKIQHHALRLINRFLLASRRNITISDEYRSIQLQRMQQKLFANSLGLLSHYKWDLWKLTITVLNLCDAFDTGHPELLQKGIVEFESLINDGYINTKSPSLEYIRELLIGFKVKGGACVPSSVTEVPDKFIYYRGDLGYLICEGVKKDIGGKYLGHVYTPALDKGDVENVDLIKGTIKILPVSFSKSSHLTQ